MISGSLKDQMRHVVVLKSSYTAFPMTEAMPGGRSSGRSPGRTHASTSINHDVGISGIGSTALGC